MTEKNWSNESLFPINSGDLLDVFVVELQIYSAKPQNHLEIHLTCDRLLRLFEAGIYSKLTEDEYLNLRQNRDGSPDNRMVSEGANNEVDGMQMHLKAMSMKTLQGAFYVLIIGYIFSGKYV